jgi:tRNA:m4X modification enzyme
MIYWVISACEFAYECISACRFDQFSHEEKEEIGLQCKRLIDIGRMKYLEASGYEVLLKKYVSKELTLENIAMVVLPADMKDS